MVIRRHEVDYLRPVDYALAGPARSGPTVRIELWIEEMRARRFTVAYELFDGDVLASRARSVLRPVRPGRQRPRRISPEERAFLLRYAPSEPRDRREHRRARAGRRRRRGGLPGPAGPAGSGRAGPAPRRCAGAGRTRSGPGCRGTCWWSARSPAPPRGDVDGRGGASCWPSWRPAAGRCRAARDDRWRWPLPPAAEPGGGDARRGRAAADRRGGGRHAARGGHGQGVGGRRSGERVLRDALLDHVAMVVTPDDAPDRRSRCRSGWCRRWSGWASSAPGDGARCDRSAWSAGPWVGPGRDRTERRGGGRSAGSRPDAPVRSSERMTYQFILPDLGRPLGGCLRPGCPGTVHPRIQRTVGELDPLGSEVRERCRGGHGAPGPPVAANRRLEGGSTVDGTVRVGPPARGATGATTRAAAERSAMAEMPAQCRARSPCAGSATHSICSTSGISPMATATCSPCGSGTRCCSRWRGRTTRSW